MEEQPLSTDDLSLSEADELSVGSDDVKGGSQGKGGHGTDDERGHGESWLVQKARSLRAKTQG